MKRVTVFVGGIRSVLQSTESEEYIRHVANRADQMLRSVKYENPSLSTDKAAVLALINAIDQLQKSESKRSAKAELDLQDRRRIERLEAALDQAKEIVLETQNRLNEYEAREELMEAGLIPMWDRNTALADAVNQLDTDSRQNLYVNMVDPKQLSIQEIIETSSADNDEKASHTAGQTKGTLEENNEKN